MYPLFLLLSPLSALDTVIVGNVVFGPWGYKIQLIVLSTCSLAHAARLLADPTNLVPRPNSMGFVWGGVGRAVIQFMLFAALFAMLAILATSVTPCYPL